MPPRIALLALLTSATLLPPQASFAGEVKTAAKSAVKATGGSAKTEPRCALSKDLSLEEQQALHRFNARLGHLKPAYGRAEFNSALEAQVKNNFPEMNLIEVSPVFYEKARNLVDQAKLRDVVARTIGLDHPDWKKFEEHMKAISLSRGLGKSLTNPFEKSALQLMKAINDRQKSGGPARVIEDPRNARVHGQRFTKSQVEKIQRDWENGNTEAIARISDMYQYLARWRANNAEMTFEEAEASAKKVAVAGLGMVGIGVLYGTLVFAAPVVAGVGAATSSAVGSSAMAPLLVKLAETAAGAGVGIIGAPAARTVLDSYHTLSEAGKQSANKQTNYLCELDKQMGEWRSHAGDRLLSSALVGATMGTAGGLLTFSAHSAKAVLWATGLGVGVAELYAAGKMTQTGVEAMANYKMAQEAMDGGNRELALKHLHKARDLAQESGEHLLEGVIIGLLAYHVSHNFKQALGEGEKAIRQLYASAADTLPTAGKAAIKVGGMAGPQLEGVANHAVAKVANLKGLAALLGKSQGLSSSSEIAAEEIKRDLRKHMSQEEIDRLMKATPAQIRQRLQALNEKNGVDKK